MKADKFVRPQNPGTLLWNEKRVGHWSSNEQNGTGLKITTRGE